MKQDNDQVNLLALVPVHRMDWNKDEDGLITILKPKFMSSFFRKYLIPRMKRPHYKVKLDKKGSFIWNHIDGERNVQDIANFFLKKFGEEIEPLYDRLAAFFQQLERSGFITFKNI